MSSPEALTAAHGIESRVLLFTSKAQGAPRRLLERCACRVETVATSVAAFDAARTFRPHLLVADVDAEFTGGGVVAADYVRWLGIAVRFLLFADDVASAGVALARARGFGAWVADVDEFEEIVPRDLPLAVLAAEADRARGESAPKHAGISLRRCMDAMERHYCVLSLHAAKGRVGEAAALLGRDRTVFARRIARFGIDPREFKPKVSQDSQSPSPAT